MPLEENPYTVPHLKAFNSGQKLWGLQRCGSTLSLSNALLKISILLHKMASGWFILMFAVSFDLTCMLLPFLCIGFPPIYALVEANRVNPIVA